MLCLRTSNDRQNANITVKGCLRFCAFTSFACSVLLLASCGESSRSEANGADPGVLEAPIAYVKRPVPVNNQGQSIQADLRRPRLFSSGGDVFIRSNSTSTSTASEINITRSITQGIGDVKGLNVSYDARRIIFSLRLFDPNPNDDLTPSWNIYEYDLELNNLRRVISSDLLAEEGDDLFPTYLPDGRILFSSSRQLQSQEVLSDEGKPRFSALDENLNTIALVLHVMNSDGSEIHQISFNQSHDLTPLVLSSHFSGQVVFSRWDNAGANSAVSLYKSNPDGSDLELFYGAHSHATGSSGNIIQFTRVREMLNGDLVAITLPFSGTFDGGDIVIIDADSFVDIDRPVLSMTGLGTPAQTSATVNGVTNDGSLSPNGRYSSAFPLLDGSNRMLVSKSSCQILVDSIIRPCIPPWVSDPNGLEQSPAYGIWLYDLSNDTEKVVVRAEQGIVITDVVALQSKPLPNIIFDRSTGLINAVWRDAGVGVINIKSVYDFGDASFNGCFLASCTTASAIASVTDLGDPARTLADQRPARFVRFLKAVAFPDGNDPLLLDPPDLSNSAFGPQLNQRMREIVGYAPVEPDGSVKVKVPANIPLAVEVLDRAGRRIGPRHENWFQVNPGDTTSCNGGHTHVTQANTTALAHHRADANAASINPGLDASLVFANTQIPGTSDAYWGDLGETQAEVRFKRVSLTVPPTPEPQLDADVLYQDVWTNPTTRPLDTSFSYTYASLNSAIPSPANSDCSPWKAKCRIVINYEQHIHPIWQIDRGADVNANTVGDDTCTECHSNVAVALDKLPDGQLDLGDGVSDLNAERFKSYQELFFSDAGQELDAGGKLVNIQIEVPVLDGNGVPVPDGLGGILTEFIDDPAAVVPATMSANGARGSYFIEKLTETELEAGRSLSTPATNVDYFNHAGLLSADELRLISEWLDIGAQYFNDPFDPSAPQN